MTWTCHVCGDERPDEMIAVYSRTVRSRSTGVELKENVRHCRDREACVEGARTKSWVMSGDNWEEVSHD